VLGSVVPQDVELSENLTADARRAAAESGRTVAE
jgi:hypothetical protein